MEITVAKAAAVINVAIILAQITYPLLFALLAVGVLRRTTNVATWSVFSRLINRSWWPRILRTDVISGVKVDKRVRALSIASTVAALVLAIAAAITPLGLQAVLRLEKSASTAFTYVRDDSPIGGATPARSSYQNNRVCTTFSTYIPCPASNNPDVYYNDTGNFSTSGVQSDRAGAFIQTGIAPNVTEVFTSFTGKDKSTIAGAFDVQYRSFINYNNATKPPNVSDQIEWLDGGKPRTQSQFRYYQQFILNDKVQAVEGLVIDTGANPGIGFRNHTLPPASALGYSWTEPILWLEPETVCTNLNLTFDYTMPDINQGASVAFDTPGPPHACLTDRGGIVDLPKDAPPIDVNNTQLHPMLLERSWRGAWYTNQLLMKYFNVTRNDTSMGKEYSVKQILNDKSSTHVVLPNSIAFGQYGSGSNYTNSYNPGLPAPLDVLYRLNDTYANTTAEQEESVAAFFQVKDYVYLYAADFPMNISTIGIHAGVFMGVGTQVDGAGNPVKGDAAFNAGPGTNWTQPLYSCVSAVKASVKMVTFAINGTNAISDMVVKDVQPSNYTEDDMPTWAMEYYPNNTVSSFSPFWGLVSPDRAGSEGIQTVRQPEFYVPAGTSALYLSSLSTIDATAMTAAPWLPFAAIDYVLWKTGYTNGLSPNPDYSGISNFLLSTRWQNLSQSVTSVGRVKNLIWTDLMANLVVGTKSPLSTSSPNQPVESIDMPAESYSNGITYDWRYAIPAFVFAALYTALLLISLVLLITRNLTVHSLRFFLNQTAAGRSITTERYHAEKHEVDYAVTNVWARVRGEELVRVGKDTAHSTGSSYRPPPSNSLSSPEEGAAASYYSSLNDSSGETKVDGYLQTQQVTTNGHSPAHSASFPEPPTQTYGQGGGMFQQETVYSPHAPSHVPHAGRR